MHFAVLLELPRLISASVVFLGILGGSMTTASGVAALPAYLGSGDDHVLAILINRGLAAGFVLGFPFAVLAFIVAVTGNVGT